MKNNHSIFLCLALAGSLVTSARADIITFKATLGPEAVGATGSGSAVVWFDETAQTMRVKVQFTGLSGTTRASHIHGATTEKLTGTAPVITQLPSFEGFPLGVTAGSYDRSFDLTLAGSYNPAFLNNAANAGSTTAASGALLQALMDQKAYLNIHSSTFPPGEIRGFLTVPDPSVTFGLFSLGLFALGGLRRFLPQV